MCLKNTKEIGDGCPSLAGCFYLIGFYQDTFKQRLNCGVQTLLVIEPTLEVIEAQHNSMVYEGYRYIFLPATTNTQKI